MNREYVDVVELRRISEVKVLQDTFELRPERPAVWLQRVCLWVLRKLGCFASTDVIRYERHHIGKNGERFMQRLLKAKNAIQGSLEMKPTRLLIGSEQYAELMEEMVSKAPFAFDSQYYIGGYDRPTVIGLRVEVIPWMRGILLLPPDSTANKGGA